MGYYASGYGMITIRTDYDTPTLQKLYNRKRWTSATVQKNFKPKLFLI